MGIKEIIVENQREKERIISRRYVNREAIPGSLKHIQEPLIKVIIGPRRAGKSVFSMLLLKDKKFGYLNFDDDRLQKINDHSSLLGKLAEVYPETEFMMLDEIQNLPQWELLVNKMHRRGNNVIVTGSNSRLLSSELATALTGRYVDIEILPFSFREFLIAFGEKAEGADIFQTAETRGKYLNLLTRYLEDGGFPDVVVNKVDPVMFLGTLVDSILFKDIVRRYRVRHAQDLYALAEYLITNFTKEFSYTKLKKILQIGSVPTVQKYLGYLEGAYLLMELNRFSFKLKEQINAPKKIYVVDTGLVKAKAFKSAGSTGRLMENSMFLHLVRKGFRPNRELFYYKTRNAREVDFVLKEGRSIKNLIQVTVNLNYDNRDREIKGLLEASQELRCNNLVIVTWDTEDNINFKGREIKIASLLRMLTVRTI